MTDDGAVDPRDIAKAAVYVAADGGSEALLGMVETAIVLALARATSEARSAPSWDDVRADLDYLLFTARRLRKQRATGHAEHELLASVPQEGSVS